MKVYYDLHIHSALSPCGDNDMTPNNIVNMSIIKGLDVIAICDHNSCGNVRSAIEAADGRIIVIPGMEIETIEEVHMVSLFPNVDSAEEMEKVIRQSSPYIKNRPDIFGNQYYMDKNDEIIGEEERLLVAATGLDVYEVIRRVTALGGVSYPAHIDRSSYSILSNLGFIPSDLEIGSVEITEKNLDTMSKQYNEYNIITSSDAHYLENISERTHFLDISAKSKEEILSKLLNGKF